MSSNEEQQQQHVPDAFRGVLASLQHVVPKWQRLQTFTSASKTAPSNGGNNNNSQQNSKQPSSRSMIAATPSHNNYASTGDLRVLCAMGGGVGEMHDNALRDYFFTEIANPQSDFAKNADDLLLVVVPTAVACPKNNYPPSSAAASANGSKNNSSLNANNNEKKEDNNEQQQQQQPSLEKQSVGDKISGAFKMFAKKISNAVSSNNKKDETNNNNNNNDDDDSNSVSSPNGDTSSTATSPLFKNAPPFLSLHTNSHLCADSHDPISAGEYSIKSSTISVFRRGIPPLQPAVEQSLEYVQILDDIHDKQFAAQHQSNPRRRGSSNSSSHLQQNPNNLSGENLDQQQQDVFDGNGDDNRDELRRSSNNLSHQAFLADPPVRRLSSSEFDTNNSNETGSPSPFVFNSSSNNTNNAEPIQYPNAPKFTQLLNIPREPNWFATVALNLACQWPYYLNVAVVKMLRSPDFANVNTPTPVAIRTVQRQVYPTLHPPRNVAKNFSSPFGRDAREASAQDDEMRMQYPDLHFSVDDFEEAFGDIRLAPGHKLAVLLTAGGPPNQDSDAVAVFRGVVNYENLMAQLKKQEKVTGVAIASRPGATNNSSSAAGFAASGEALYGPPAVVPLKSQSGRAEVAIWLTEADLEAMRSNGSQNLNDNQNNNTPEHQQQQANYSPSSCANDVFGGRGLQGTEILHCALTRVSLHVSHVVSAMLQGVPWASLHASWLPKQSANPVTKNKWMIFPPTKEHLTKWLDDDTNFNKARAAAGTGTTTDDVRRLLTS